jgi:predicted nuclease of predicted toxin-antitoxin system
VKLLLDQNLSRRMLPALETLFPGSSQTALLGLAEAEDGAIWEFAKREGYAIVTKDADFVELSMMRGYPPKVVLLNMGNVSNTTLLARLCAEAEALQDFFANTTEGVLEIE